VTRARLEFAAARLGRATEEVERRTNAATEAVATRLADTSQDIEARANAAAELAAARLDSVGRVIESRANAVAEFAVARLDGAGRDIETRTNAATEVATARLGGATQDIETIVQNLSYFYDPVGNITRIEDAALKTVFNANQQVDSACDYLYDPLYRLIQATGREHIGQSAFAFSPPDGNYRDYPFVGVALQSNLQALRNYTERYDYDPANNFETLSHQAPNGNWTRAYTYNASSLIEPAKKSNCLSQTALQTSGNPPAEPYSYDAHGNTVQMPHLPLMQWNFREQLSASSRQVVNAGAPETIYYVYDAGGQRSRKITESRNGGRKTERFYLGGFEVYREYASGVAPSLERQTLYVMDDKQRIALIETQTIGSGAAGVLTDLAQRYQLGNHLGSASLELDGTGGLISHEEYGPYGNTTYQAGRSAAELSLKRYRYTGKERDEGSGFTYHGARYYAPWLGRWLSADAIGIADGVNGYRYCNTNPIKQRDTNGMQGEDTQPKLQLTALDFRSSEQRGKDRVIESLSPGALRLPNATPAQPSPAPPTTPTPPAPPATPAAPGDASKPTERPKKSIAILGLTPSQAPSGGPSGGRSAVPLLDTSRRPTPCLRRQIDTTGLKAKFPGSRESSREFF
jgi:RHS repeat-associated protein